MMIAHRNILDWIIFSSDNNFWMLRGSERVLCVTGGATWFPAQSAENHPDSARTNLPIPMTSIALSFPLISLF